MATPLTIKGITNVGYLYVIRAVGTNLYKIGITSRSVADRLKELQTGNPIKLEVVRSYQFIGTSKIERELHEHLYAYRRSGEWFELSSAQTVDKALESLDYISANEIEEFVFRQVGIGSGSSRFDFSMSVLTNKELGKFGKLAMFLWSLFVPGEPIIGRAKIEETLLSDAWHDDDEEEDADYRVLE